MFSAKNLILCLLIAFARGIPVDDPNAPTPEEEVLQKVLESNPLENDIIKNNEAGNVVTTPLVEESFTTEVLTATELPQDGQQTEATVVPEEQVPEVIEEKALEGASEAAALVVPEEQVPEVIEEKAPEGVSEAAAPVVPEEQVPEVIEEKAPAGASEAVAPGVPEEKVPETGFMGTMENVFEGIEKEVDQMFGIGNKEEPKTETTTKSNKDINQEEATEAAVAPKVQQGGFGLENIDPINPEMTGDELMAEIEKEMEKEEDLALAALDGKLPTDENPFLLPSDTLPEVSSVPETTNTPIESTLGIEPLVPSVDVKPSSPLDTVTSDTLTTTDDLQSSDYEDMLNKDQQDVNNFNMQIDPDYTDSSNPDFFNGQSPDYSDNSNPNYFDNQNSDYSDNSNPTYYDNQNPDFTQSQNVDYNDNTEYSHNPDYNQGPNYYNDQEANSYASKYDDYYPHHNTQQGLSPQSPILSLLTKVLPLLFGKPKKTKTAILLGPQVLGSSRPLVVEEHRPTQSFRPNKNSFVFEIGSYKSPELTSVDSSMDSSSVNNEDSSLAIPQVLLNPILRSVVRSRRPVKLNVIFLKKPIEEAIPESFIEEEMPMETMSENPDLTSISEDSSISLNEYPYDPKVSYAPTYSHNDYVQPEVQQISDSAPTYQDYDYYQQSQPQYNYNDQSYNEEQTQEYYDQNDYRRPITIEDYYPTRQQIYASQRPSFWFSSNRWNSSPNKNFPFRFFK